ncbi:MAG TPA: DUF2336 domain-containing protein, partial [Candidatus Cybelea sp.]|nr:DUF2336 domain-containing protein [Candidatus Cybelea sp.]
MSDPFDIETLLRVARDRSPEGRSRLFAMLGRLFLARGGELNARERRGFAELLAILRPRADPETRLELAYATAESPSAPSELALLLAGDEIEIASLVLFDSSALDSEALLILADEPERAPIIAARHRLPMAVADALMRRGDLELTRILLKNQGVALSIPAMAEAIELARDHPELQRLVAARAELLEEMAIEMTGWVEAPVGETLIARFELGAGASEGALAEILAGLGLESGPPPEADFPGPVAREESAAPIVAEEPAGPRPDPRFRLSPRLMIDTLRHGERARAEAMFAAMATLPTALIRKFVADPIGERIAVAARAIGMAREEFATIYLLWRKAQAANGAVAVSDLGAALDHFDTL